MVPSVKVRCHGSCGLGDFSIRLAAVANERAKKLPRNSPGELQVRLSKMPNAPMPAAQNDLHLAIGRHVGYFHG